MARIKHIAIATDDPEATAKFYVEGLGMKQVGKLDTPTDEGYYLTDGYINLAILKFKTEEEKTFADYYQEALERQAQEKANTIKIKDCSKYDKGGFWSGVMKSMDGC